ncbi:MAG TPA: hypothetical protein VFK57_24845 [Vicinamibacterales bacterium]|nr:hypothetical protein [Vicinamibacterales bacterium]
MRDRWHRLTAAALVFLFAMCAGADVLCAAPCRTAAQPVGDTSSAPAAHCQSMPSPADAVRFTPANSCTGEHGVLAPAEVTSRRAVADTPAALPLPSSLWPHLGHSLFDGTAARAPHPGSSGPRPPLRI